MFSHMQQWAAGSIARLKHFVDIVPAPKYAFGNGRGGIENVSVHLRFS
jgi:hypothetical protein